MEYVLRDRPDGTVDIVQMVPHFVGTFASRSIAERVRGLLGAIDLHREIVSDIEEEIAPPIQPDASFGIVETSVTFYKAATIPDTPPPAPVPMEAAPAPIQLPAVVDRPRMPAVIEAPKLSEAMKEAAFHRLHAGEKLASVAPDFGLTMGQLRGMWANHKRIIQAHIAEGGPQPCQLCKKPFTPSVSNPDTCARCSREM